MLKLSRVCVPLSLDCNLHCRYCYRDKEKLDKIPEFTEDMKDYLRNLSPDWCEAVIASGGEPLLHWDKVEELFSYVPKNVHKKIMSNCILLDQKMVDYMNNNEIEMHFSHDGKMTKFLRGVDILEDEKIVNLLRQIKILRCYAVMTKYNPNVWENYFDTVRKLQRIDMNYETMPLNDVSPEQHYLVEGFDYDTWFETWVQFRSSPFYKRLPWYNGRTLKFYNPPPGRGVGVNVLPDGTLCGMIRICDVYGSIYSTGEEYHKKAVEIGLASYCNRIKCPYTDRCQAMLQHSSDHICKTRQMTMDCSPERIQEIREYTRTHLLDIVEKYGFKDIADELKKNYGLHKG